MKRFPRDTKDAIERLWAHEVLKLLPHYGNFWEKFVGVKDQLSSLRPYGLRLPNRIPRLQRSSIRRAYEEMTMAHYTLFCNLAGAHAQIKVLERVSSPFSSNQNWFRHWEAFESIYLHLGISFYEVHHLWDILFLMRGQLRRKKDGSIERIPTMESPYSLRVNEFRSSRKLGFWRDFQQLVNYVSRRRDNITHYSRGAWRPVGDKIAVPEQARPNTPWSSESNTKHWWITTLRAQSDLEQSESMINGSHEVLIASIEGFLANNGITINAA